MARHQDEVEFLGQGDQLRSLVGGPCERLLHQHVLAGLEGPADERVVGVRGRRDGHRLDPRVRKRGIEVALDPDAGMAAAEVIDAVVVQLAEPHEAELGPLNDVADDVGAPVAVSDDHGPECTLGWHCEPFLDLMTAASGRGYPKNGRTGDDFRPARPGRTKKGLEAARGLRICRSRAAKSPLNPTFDRRWRID